MELKELDKDFAYELMSIPTYSGHEHRIITYITLFAERNGIKYDFDKHGNLYLTKGELSEGEFYPAMTAHVDSVQSAHKPYILSGENLKIETRDGKDGKTEIYVDGFGLGGDDKCGVLIALSVIQKVDKLKVSLFLEEETGCQGSRNMNVSFFDNVGYVIGFDSPDFNRSAWSVSGTQLFSKDFYLEHMKPVCDKHGRTKFFSEPFTDLTQIREKVPIQGMNFGSGYYNMHSNTEYVVLEEVDDCISLALDLIEELGHKRYELPVGKNISFRYVSPYIKAENLTEQERKDKEEMEFMRSLEGKAYTQTLNYGGYGGYGGYDGYDNYYDDDEYWANYANGFYDSMGIDDSKKKKKRKKYDMDDLFSDEKVLLYIMRKYDSQIEDIRAAVKEKCEKLGIDYEAEFAQIFKDSDVSF